MPRPARRLSLKLLAAMALALASSLAFAATLAVHPFYSDDALLGTAVSDELAAAFGGSALVIGPEVASGAIPPLMADGGFIGLSRVVGAETMYGPAGADLLRTGLGVDVAVTGRVLVMEDDFRLDLELASAAGTVHVSLTAPHGRRDRLVAQAARVVARALGSSGAPTPPASPQLTGAYASYMTAVVYAANGLVTDAASVLASVPAADLPERGQRLKEDVDAATALQGAPGSAGLGEGRALRRAILSLGVAGYDDAASAAAFDASAEATGLPLASAWSAVMAASIADWDASAQKLAVAAASGSYPYADALAASLAWATGDVGSARTQAAAVVSSGASAGSAALLGASIVAQIADDLPLEKSALGELTRAAPFLTYAFERLSFIAFDEEDPLAAAEALAAAVELDPESDLYWTNLGWAYYLLGFLDRSESASLRAVELDANQYIAAYNIGLVRAVTGRLADAIKAYDQAMRLDPSVDDEAVADLERATADYPGSVAVHYALAYLYDAEGRRADARAEYRRFVRRAGTDYADLVTAAQQRLVVLNAPPPPLEITGGMTARLGVRGPEAAPFHPGDRLFPSFEVSTPGDELPGRLGVTLTLAAADSVLLTQESEVTVPAGAVGYVIDSVGLDLPADLAPGTYELGARVDGVDGTSVADSAQVEVEGEPVALRQLLSRGVVMTGLASSSPLYSAKDLGRPEALVDTLLAELRSAASAAEEALPTVTTGRFQGLSGSQLFEQSTAEDVEDYLDYLLAGGTSDFRFAFVDGYAQWALDGAPAGD